jgi:hypothetical protein
MRLKSTYGGMDRNGQADTERPATGEPGVSAARTSLESLLETARRQLQTSRSFNLENALQL